jgi:succinate-semialdehyde dehydrogenase/glutarate-semialdehyde dehydrogenase
MTGTPASESVLDGTAWTDHRLDRLAARIGAPTTSATGRIPVAAPTADEQIGSVPELTPADVETAVTRTRSAVAAWRATSVTDRSAVIEQFANLVADNQKELLDLVQLETGKSRIDAFEEVIEVPQSADYYAGTARSVLSSESRGSGLPVLTATELQYDPVGIVGVISPWNYPLVLSFTDLIPALLAGNGVVLKPDEKTPFTAIRLAELLFEAGLPKGVLTVVTGDGPTVGGTLIDTVDYITFTGSSETGRTVAERAGRNLIDCSLELSGKNPFIVLDEADLDMAVRGAINGAFTNAGQLCLATERIYVERPRYEDFLDAFVAATTEIELGAPFEYTTDVGSLIGRDQLERVESHVTDAVESGATVQSGAQARRDIGPYFYEPTILTDVPSDSLPACEETFGPVVTVEPVQSGESAVETANSSAYGLNGSVWSTDSRRAKSIARRLDCGTVCINDSHFAGWAAYDAPMGGVGQSGIGRRHGPEGLLRYTEPKTVATSRVGPLGSVPGVPDSLYTRVVTTLTNAQRRLRQWWR